MIDTSGVVAGYSITAAKVLSTQTTYNWSDLNPFTQGFVEAALAALGEEYRDERGAYRFGFSDLAPETLARFMEDCAEFQRFYVARDPNAAGGSFWVNRQRRCFIAPGVACFPPISLYLADDGKVRIAD